MVQHGPTGNLCNLILGPTGIGPRNTSHLVQLNITWTGPRSNGPSDLVHGKHLPVFTVPGYVHQNKNRSLIINFPIVYTHGPITFTQSEQNSVQRFAHFAQRILANLDTHKKGTRSFVI